MSRNDILGLFIAHSKDIQGFEKWKLDALGHRLITI